MAGKGAPLGNDYATKSKPWIRALEKAIVQDPNKLRNIALKVLDMAEQGDMAAIREIGDRLDGKAVQQIQAAHSFEGALARELSNEQLAIIAAGGTLSDGDGQPETLQ